MTFNATNAWAFTDRVTRYLLTTNGNRCVYGFETECTVVFWIRLKTAGTAGNKLGIRSTDATLLRGGVRHFSGDLTLGVSDGFVHVT